MITNFLNGKSSLAATYWVGIVGFGLIINAGNAYIINRYLTTQDEVALEQVELGHKIFLIVSTILVLLLLRAMIKSGFNKRTPGGWGWLGIGIATLGVANVGYATATLLMPSLPTPRFMLEMEIAEINKQLPQAMDAVTMLRRAELIGNDLFYFLEVSDQTIPGGKALMIEAFTTQGEEGKALCRDFEGYFHGGLDSVAYEFTFTNETVVAQLTAEDCLTFLTNN